MSISDITIIITSFKSSVVIKSCLSSIDSNCQVIVVENSKDEDFKNLIENDFKNVKCILSGENLGYGKANNIALKIVNTKYALILNPDTVLEKNTLENFLKATKKIPDFAIMAPYIQDVKNKSNVITDINFKQVENVKGFAMFFNIEKFKDVGFFDENFFIYFEEIDLCKRLNKKNKKIYLVPSIKINHTGGRSHDQNINSEMELSRNWHWMWSTFYYHKKYKGIFISFLIVFPNFISALIKLIIYSIFFMKDKRKIYYQRFSGLINAIFGKKSWYRPKI